ncbi:MAG TPA: CD225/dispanin family protein [Rubrivivax sp.]|nr:CD225/dispanin family protein [Rubrivivax sp.]
MGIVAIVHVAMVDEKRASGDLPGAREASHKAKFWALLSFAIAVIPVTLYLLFTLLLVGIGILGGLSASTKL